MAAVQETIDQVKSIDVTEYKYGFITDIEMDKPAKGLTEDTVRYISARKNEPEWMLEWRLDAFRRWKTMTEPNWARVNYPPIDYQDIYYYAAPKSGPIRNRSTRSIRRSWRPTRSSASRCASRRSWPASRRSAASRRCVFDSVSVVTTFKKELARPA
jgi:Fe-S cluster assembly protein SufB